MGVVTGKFLGFVITKDGITVDPAKTKAILEMKPPTNLRELKRLQGFFFLHQKIHLNPIRKVSTVFTLNDERDRFRMGSSL